MARRLLFCLCIMRTQVLALLLGLGALASGCDPVATSSDGVTTGARSTVELTPSSVEATRTPASCGVTEPAFSSKDVLTLEVVGETDVAPPFATLTLQLAAGVTTGTAIPLTVDSNGTAGAETASSAYGTVSFSLTVGDDTTELDSSGLESVVVTVTALPTADGDPLTAEVQVSFVDGRELDQTYTGTLRTAVVLCPKAATSNGPG